MKNFMTEFAATSYLMQQRLELMSYSGIAHKAALESFDSTVFFCLMEDFHEKMP